MACDAQRGLLVNARDAVVDAAPARRVGVPRIAGRQDVIDAGPDGLARIAVRRRIVHARAQLIFGMPGVHRDEVRAALLQHARRELVPRQRLHFVRHGHGIFALEVLLELAAGETVNRHVHRDLVALHQVDLEEDELRRGRGEVELVPVAARAVGQRLARGAGERDVLLVIARCEDCSAERNRHGVLPAGDRPGFDRAGNGPAVDRQRVAPAGVLCADRHGRGARSQDAELRVEIGIACVQGFRGQHRRALPDLHFDRRLRAERLERRNRIEDAVGGRWREVRKRDRLRRDGPGLRRYRQQSRRHPDPRQQGQTQRHSHLLCPRIFYHSIAETGAPRVSRGRRIARMIPPNTTNTG